MYFLIIRYIDRGKFMLYNYDIKSVTKKLVLFYLNELYSKEDMLNMYSRAKLFNQPIIVEIPYEHYGIRVVELELLLNENANNSIYIVSMNLHCDYKYIEFLSKKVNIFLAEMVYSKFYIDDTMFQFHIFIDIESDLSVYKDLYFISDKSIKYNIDFYGRKVKLLEPNRLYDLTINQYFDLISCNALLNDNLRILLCYSDKNDLILSLNNFSNTYKILGNGLIQFVYIMDDMLRKYSFSPLYENLDDDVAKDISLLIYYRTTYQLSDIVEKRQILESKFKKVYIEGI